MMADSPLKFIVAEYLGKELTKSGEGKYGKWSLFKVKMKVDGRDMKFNSFAKLSTKGLQLDQIKEGEMYNVGYTSDDYTMGNDTIKVKSIKIISLLTDNPKSDVEVSISSDKIVLYKEKVPADKRSLWHFVGAVMYAQMTEQQQKEWKLVYDQKVKQ